MAREPSAAFRCLRRACPAMAGRAAARGSLASATPSQRAAGHDGPADSSNSTPGPAHSLSLSQPQGLQALGLAAAHSACAALATCHTWRSRLPLALADGVSGVVDSEGARAEG